MWWFAVVIAFPLYLFTAERVTAFVRNCRIETRRAKAEYPTTANDPVGRTVIFCPTVDLEDALRDCRILTTGSVPTPGTRRSPGLVLRA